MIRLKRLELSNKPRVKRPGERGRKPPVLKADLAKRQEGLDEALKKLDLKNESYVKDRQTLVDSKWKAFLNTDRERKDSIVGKLNEMSHQKCAYCEEIGGTIDHVWPKGTYPEKTFVLDNLLPCCSSCNPIKATKFELVDDAFEKVPKWLDPRTLRDDPYRNLTFTVERQPSDASGPSKIDPLGWLDPRKGLSDVQFARVEYTIFELELNSVDRLLHPRALVISAFLKLCEDLVHHGPDARWGPNTVRGTFALLLSRRSKFLGPIRQILRDKPYLRDALIDSMDELKEELAAWDLDPNS